MNKQEYRKLLRHPEWQKMKTRVQVRADFKCERPGCSYILDENNQLHVHHTYYQKGLKPWEYPIDSLQCLCERHHELAHEVPNVEQVNSEEIIKEKEEEFDFHDRKLVLEEFRHSMIEYSDFHKDYEGWVGTFCYGQNDKLSTFSYYKSGKYDGRSLVWDANGNKTTDSNYIDGKKNGYFYLGYRSDPNEPKQKLEANFILDQLDGEFSQWYENGNIRSSRLYDYGKLLEASSWKLDGTPCNITSIKNGNGPLIIYDDYTGKKEIEENYQDGLRNGAWMKFMNGFKHHLSEEGQFSNGLMSGSWRKYGSTGNNVMFEVEYINGNLFSEKPTVWSEFEIEPWEIDDES